MFSAALSVVGAALPVPVERLYRKRPSKCLASSKIWTHHPLTAGECVLPRLWCGGRIHSLGEEGGGGVNILDDARHSCVLYICKYFVPASINMSTTLCQLTQLECQLSLPLSSLSVWQVEDYLFYLTWGGGGGAKIYERDLIEDL